MRRTAIADLAAALLAAATALVLGLGWDVGGDGEANAVLGVAIAAAWPVLLAASGAYAVPASLFGVEELRRVLRAALLLLASAGALSIVLGVQLSRGYFLAVVALLVAFTACGRQLLNRFTARDDVGHHRVVAVGPASDIVQFCSDLDRTHTSGLVEVVAYVADDLEPEAAAPAPLADLPRLPNRDAIQAIKELDEPVDLLVRAGRPGPDEVWAMTQRAHGLGVTVAVAPHGQEATAAVAMNYVPLGSTPLLMVETPTLHAVASITKAVLDRVVAALALVALTPLFLVIAATIAIRDGRPVIFSQERVGRYGGRFTCFKFRTMRVGAERLLPGMRDQNEVDGPRFKVRDDPRVTRTGAFLRRHSLDELPQLVNVLRGDMSIVGPRPPLPSEVAGYNARTARRLTVKPGLTGLWQTQGRSDLPWNDGIYLDLLYIDHWSPLLDLVIIARTVRSVVRPEGAY